MPALVAGIHVLLRVRQDVDGRDEPGHDETTERSVYSADIGTADAPSLALARARRSRCAAASRLVVVPPGRYMTRH
jgi:hypothetical protein